MCDRADLAHLTPRSIFFSFCTSLLFGISNTFTCEEPVRCRNGAAQRQAQGLLIFESSCSLRKQISQSGLFFERFRLIQGEEKKKHSSTEGKSLPLPQLVQLGRFLF